MSIGFQELLLTLIIALALLKPEQLKATAKELGVLIRALVKEKQAIEKELEEPAKEIVQPFSEIKDTINHLTK